MLLWCHLRVETAKRPSFVEKETVSPFWTTQSFRRRKLDPIIGVEQLCGRSEIERRITGPQSGTELEQINWSTIYRYLEEVL